MKWCYIGPEQSYYNKEHLEALSEELKENKIENEVQLIQTDAAFFSAEIKKIFDSFDFIRIDPLFFELVTGTLGHTIVEVVNLNSVDSISKDKKNIWWPRGYLKTAFTHFVSQNCKDVGVTFPTLVIGANGISRAIIASLVHIGFTHVVLVDQDEEKAKSELEDLQKLFFQVKFEHTKKEKLTLLPGIHSLVVNTLSVLQHKDLFYELYYCNYLKKGAMVLDLNLYPLVTPLLRLSEGIGGSIFSGYQFWGHLDMEWCLGEFNVELNKDSYMAKLKQIYSKIPFDESKVFDSQF